MGVQGTAGGSRRVAIEMRVSHRDDHSYGHCTSRELPIPVLFSVFTDVDSIHPHYDPVREVGL